MGTAKRIRSWHFARSRTRRLGGGCHPPSTSIERGPTSLALAVIAAAWVLVSEWDVCCVNLNGDGFPCQGQGGGCCGNACYAPGSKCCRSLIYPKSRWYPVTQATECASGFVGFPR